MSRNPSPWTPKGKLNNIAPGAKEVGLGDIIDDLITAHNDLVAKYNALCAKLDTAGGTVAGLGTNYASTVGAPAGDTVTVLASR